MRWYRRLWYLLNRRALERELEREMAAHRAMMGDARRFGSTLRLREESADVWGWTWLERIGQDLRFAARLLRRRPVLSATAILTLMLGIGGTTAVFGLLDALHLKSLPVADPNRLVRLVERAPTGSPVEAFTLITHDTLQRSSRTLAGVAASSSTAGRPADIGVGGETRQAFVQYVSDNYPPFSRRWARRSSPVAISCPPTMSARRSWPSSTSRSRADSCPRRIRSACGSP